MLKIILSKMSFLKGGGYKLIWTVALLVSFVLIILNVLYTSSVLQTEQVILQANKYKNLYYMLCIFFFGVILFLIVRQNEKLCANNLFLVFSIFYLILGLYLIFNIDTTIRDDAYTVKSAAVDFSNHDYHSLDEGEYLFRFPYQLGMVTYDRILGLFSKNTQFIFLVNLFEIIGINWFCYKLTDLIFSHNHNINLISIFLSFSCLPQFFFMTFAYGTIPGFFFLIAGLFMLCSYTLKKKIRTLFWGVILLTIAVVLRNNFIIGILAVLIYLLLKSIEERESKYIFAAFLLFFSCIIATKGMYSYYSIESGKEINSGVPSVLYIAMGINPENDDLRAPGWYDGTVWFDYTDSGFDYDIAYKAGIDSIIASLEYYKDNPDKAVSFFKRKVISMWCEPMYQSTWSGPIEYFEQHVYTKLLYSVYNDGILSKIFSYCMKGWLLLILLSSFVFLICTRKTFSHFYIVFYLYFIGGFLFHLFWEGKSQYVYSYIYILIPCCAYGVNKALEKLLFFSGKLGYNKYEKTIF